MNILPRIPFKSKRQDCERESLRVFEAAIWTCSDIMYHHWKMPTMCCAVVVKIFLHFVAPDGVQETEFFAVHNMQEWNYFS